MGQSKGVTSWDRRQLSLVRILAIMFSSTTKDPLAKLALKQTWTAPAEKPVQQAVRAAFHSMGSTGHSLRNALHGTWLHQPLHAIVVEVPIGAWTGTVVFDALAATTGSDGMDTAADATLVLGLVGALGAAVTGINDWADTQGDAQRIGAVHGTLNVAVLGLFGASWVLRRRKRTPRTTARVLAGLGFAVLAVSSHLGGNLVYEQGVGVQDRKPLD